MDFGDRLKALREKAGMSQEKLARTANVSTSVVSKLEQKLVIDPAWSTIQALARALGVDCMAFQMDADIGQGDTETPSPKKMPRKADAAREAGTAEGETPAKKRSRRKGEH